jgi:hypothetical protein
VIGDRWLWFAPAPRERFDVLARLAFGMVLWTVLVADSWVVTHARAPREFYVPILVARVIDLPAPTPLTMTLVRITLVAACLWGMTRRAPRTAGAVVLVGYVTWLAWAFSWGKVDHDRLTLVVALLAIALTPRSGPDLLARTGWAIRLVQWTFALAYPLSAVAKLRVSGLEWPQSAVFARAIVRRGTWLGDQLLEPSWLLVVGQWAFLAFEIFAIALLLRPGWLRNVALAGVVALHLFTYATIGISFLPHTVFIAAFFPLERLRSWRPARAQGGVGGSAASWSAIAVSSSENSRESPSQRSGNASTP